MPYGAFNGVVTVALPYLLRRHGVPIERIASIGAFVQAPTIWYFLWAPIVDLGFRRRTWLIMLSVTSAAFAAAALGHDMATSIGRVTLLLVIASAINQPISSVVGGLVSGAMPDRLRGHTAGWSQAGILGGGVLAGGLSLWLAAHWSPRSAALAAALLIGVPGFAVLAVRDNQPRPADFGAHLARMRREVTATLRRRKVWLGFAYFLSPVAAGALMNLFSAVGVDFHASSNVVIAVVAIAGVLTPAAALVGGIICDHFDRWLVYPLAGFLSAASVAGMLIAPTRPLTYVLGGAAYAIATGFGYAAFMSLAFELLGTKTAASGTRFTLFMAAVNVPVVYMLRLDGLGHARFGLRGMLAADGIANAVFAVVLLVGTRWLRSIPRADS